VTRRLGVPASVADSRTWRIRPARAAASSSRPAGAFADSTTVTGQPASGAATSVRSSTAPEEMSRSTRRRAVGWLIPVACARDA
jgi:hypothetical protein